MTPIDVARMIDEKADPDVIRIVDRLTLALLNKDNETWVDAVEDLTNLLVYKYGIGLGA